MVFEREVIAREAAEGMDNYNVKRGAVGRHHIEHALQFGPAIIRATRAGLDKLDGDFPSARCAEFEGLTALVGDRQIGLCLPVRRDAHVESRALGLRLFRFFGGRVRHGNFPITDGLPIVQNFAALPSRTLLAI